MKPLIVFSAIKNRQVYLVSYFIWQRWSRRHKARGQGQGHKKIRGQGHPFRGQNISRPRTGMLEAKDQGHRRKRSPPQKKGLQNFFSGDLQFIGVPRILIGGGLNHKSHKMTSSKFFQRRSFCGTKISQNGMSEIVVACLHVTRIVQRKRT